MLQVPGFYVNPINYYLGKLASYLIYRNYLKHLVPGFRRYNTPNLIRDISKLFPSPRNNSPETTVLPLCSGVQETTGWFPIANDRCSSVTEGYCPMPRSAYVVEVNRHPQTKLTFKCLPVINCDGTVGIEEKMGYASSIGTLVVCDLDIELYVTYLNGQ